jgi:hypothetical protein
MMRNKLCLFFVIILFLLSGCSEEEISMGVYVKSIYEEKCTNICKKVEWFDSYFDFEKARCKCLDEEGNITKETVFSIRGEYEYHVKQLGRDIPPELFFTPIEYKCYSMCQEKGYKEHYKLHQFSYDGNKGKYKCECFGGEVVTPRGTLFAEDIRTFYMEDE